jgi:peptidoglycan/LPS O-acetylase OafA/YrhL
MAGEGSPACPRSSHGSGSESLLFLDGLRGLAAFYVMVGHARWLLWEGYSEGFFKHPQDYTWGGKALVYAFSLFKYGHEAVLFFFVLSGFVIHLRYSRKLVGPAAGNARFDWGAFVWRRARRLYPPLLVAIGLTFVLDRLGQTMAYGIYSQGALYQTINSNIVPNHQGLTLLGNLAFLMQTYVPAFGTDGPLWSLKFEWWFYMLYPVFWWITKRSLGLATGIMALLFVASFWPRFWPLLLLQQVFSAMLVWWLGVLLADVYAGRLRVAWGWVAMASVLLGAGLFAVPAGLCRGLAVGCAFAGLLAGCFELERRGVRLRWLERLKPLGDMSYTLYVVHLPVLVLLSGWLMARSSNGLLPRHFGWVFAGMSITLALAYALHFVVERPFLSTGRPLAKAAPNAE